MNILYIFVARPIRLLAMIRVIFAFFVMTGLVACGPSAEEKEAMKADAEQTVDELLSEFEEEIEEVTEELEETELQEDGDSLEAGHEEHEDHDHAH